MVQIVVTDQLLRDLENAEGVVEFVDANGKRLGTLVRPPSEEDIRIARDRLASNAKRHTTEEIIAHLLSQDQA